MSYQDTAPWLYDLGVTQVQVDTFLDNQAEPPAPPVVPTITKAKAAAVVKAFYETGIQQYGGISKLSHTVKLTVGQIREIMRQMKAYEAERTEANSE